MIHFYFLFAFQLALSTSIVITRNVMIEYDIMMSQQDFMDMEKAKLVSFLSFNITFETVDAFFAVAEGGCCSISDDLSCYCNCKCCQFFYVEQCSS